MDGTVTDALLLLLLSLQTYHLICVVMHGFILLLDERGLCSRVHQIHVYF